MGGRGASSGISLNGKKYGSEYRTVLKHGNIKFIKYNDADSAKEPMETMTKGRVYVLVNNEDKLKSIIYHDNDKKKNKTIGLDKPHNGLLPHVHIGYLHDGITRNLTPKEKRMVDRVTKLWYDYIGK